MPTVAKPHLVWNVPANPATPTARTAVRVTCLALLLPLISACNVILPAHSRSDDRSGENITLRGLTYSEMASNYGEAYAAAVGSEVSIATKVLTDSGGELVIDGALMTGDGAKLLSKIQGVRAVLKMEKKPTAMGAAPLGAAAAIFAVNAIIDFGVKQIEKEKSRYEAQYAVREGFDRFWLYARTSESTPKWFRIQNYAGFEVVRSTSSNPTACKMVFAIVPSHDGLFFMIQPIYLKIDSAKTKVLSFQLKDFYTALWTWALRTGSSVDLTFKVSVEAIWQDAVGNARTQEVASDVLGVRSYDLNESRVYSGEFRKDRKGWFGTIPVSVDKDGAAIGSGTFWVGVTVTERDPSNAVEVLDKAATTLSSRRAELVEAIEKLLEK